MVLMRLVRDDEMDYQDVDQSAPGEQEQPVNDAGQAEDAAGQAEDSAGQAEDAAGRDGPLQDAPDVEGDAADADEQGRVDLQVLESLLFSTHHPLTSARLAELMELPSAKPLRKAIRMLNLQYEQAGRAFRIEQVAGGYQLLTLPEYGEMINRLHRREADAKLTRAALETLAIIAYRQPVLRVDVEAIRGVACGETIRSLMEKHLVKIAGRAEVPGRPILYGTTRRFLELFGLNNLKDLPQEEELKRP
jgi:segregation and condensation protein B